MANSKQAFTIAELEATLVTEIKKAKREQVPSHFNRENHWELQAFGVTVNVFNDQDIAINNFNSCLLKNKTLYHNRSGEKHVIKSRLS